MCINEPYISIQKNGLCSLITDKKVEDVIHKITLILESNGMKIFDQISHSEGAKNAGYTIKRTELVIFGSPKIGTLLMQSNITIAIDLPQKLLITLNEKNQTVIYFNDPTYIANRHNINDCESQILNIDNTIKDTIYQAIS